MHRYMQLPQLAAIGFGERLQAEADAEDRQVAAARFLDRRRAVEIRRRALGPETGRRDLASDGRTVPPAPGCAQSKHLRRFGGNSWRAYGQSILMIDEKDVHPLAHARGLALLGGGFAAPGIADRGKHGGRFQLSLCLFFLWLLNHRARSRRREPRQSHPLCEWS